MNHSYVGRDDFTCVRTGSADASETIKYHLMHQRLSSTKLKMNAKSLMNDFAVAGKSFITTRYECTSTHTYECTYNAQ